MSYLDPSHWVQSAQAGGKQAFGQLVGQYSGLVTGVAYSVCGDFARSEDIGQETFLEAWTGLANLREPAFARPSTQDQIGFVPESTLRE